MSSRYHREENFVYICVFSQVVAVALNPWNKPTHVVLCKVGLKSTFRTQGKKEAFQESFRVHVLHGYFHAWFFGTEKAIPFVSFK